jgi:hypothetical protein
MSSFILPFVVALSFYGGLWFLLDRAFKRIDRKCDEDFERRVNRYRRGHR